MVGHDPTESPLRIHFHSVKASSFLLSSHEVYNSHMAAVKQVNPKFSTAKNNAARKNIECARLLRLKL